MNLFIKRKELWFFLFSVLFLGVGMGIVGNILFSEFYSENKLFFISFLLCILLTIVWLGIRVMFRFDKQIYSKSLVITFDMDNNKFIDIPHNPTSINVRMHFNNLSRNYQEKIMEDYTGQVKLSDEMRVFTQNAVVQIILAHFIKHSKRYNEEVNRERLKEILVKYKYIDIDDILGGQVINKGAIRTLELTLPKGFKIVSPDEDNIRIISKYGYINFKIKSLSYQRNGPYSNLLLTFKETKAHKLIDLEYLIELEYGFNPLKIFRRNTEEFNDFISRTLVVMDSFDIKQSIEKFNLNFNPKLFEYLEEKFKELKDKN